MQIISECQRDRLKSCRVTTWDGSNLRFGTRDWAALLLVTNPGIALDVLQGSFQCAGNQASRADIIIWPGTFSSTSDQIPASCRAVSLFDIEGDVTILFQPTEPWEIWRNDTPGRECAPATVIRPSWRQRADQMIDLGDVLR